MSVDRTAQLNLMESSPELKVGNSNCSQHNFNLTFLAGGSAIS